MILSHFNPNFIFEQLELSIEENEKEILNITKSMLEHQSRSKFFKPDKYIHKISAVQRVIDYKKRNH